MTSDASFPRQRRASLGRSEQSDTVPIDREELAELRKQAGRVGALEQQLETAQTTVVSFARDMAQLETQLRTAQAAQDPKTTKLRDLLGWLNARLPEVWDVLDLRQLDALERAVKDMVDAMLDIGINRSRSI